MELSGATGILTGASRGIGVYLAEALAKKGVNLALAARDGKRLERTAELARKAGVEAIAVPTDVTRRADLEKLVERTLDELGVPGLLVNNAGVERYGHFHKKPLDDIEATIATNVTGTEMLTRLVLPHMVAAKRGHIVNIASLAGVSAEPYNVVYSSTKHALVGFSWGLRAEVRRYGIGVSVICPGFISEAGMFADRHPDSLTPARLPTVTPQKVVEETIEAIEKNRAERVVTAGLARLSDVAHAIAPDATMRLARRMGAYDFLKKDADRADRELEES